MKELTYATVCSGIECMSAAVADLPMKPVFFSEIEPFPCAVLKSHFPDVPNLGDMSKITVTNEGKEITNGTVKIILDKRLDIFAGGTPCQDVSVAGKRSGMQEGSGTRSSLAFEFVRLVRELRPRIVLWENVAGVLSDKSFPEFLTALANCGYGVAYRTLDAQWVRVADCYHEDGGVVRMERAIPQRRRRVWVVGCIGGDVAKAAEILFEPQSVAGDNAPRRRTGQEIAAASRGRNRVHGGMVGDARSLGINNQGGAAPQFSNEHAETITAATNSRGNNVCGCAIALDGDKLKPRTDQRKGGNGLHGEMVGGASRDGECVSIEGNGNRPSHRGDGVSEEGCSYTLNAIEQHKVAYKRTWYDGADTAATLTTGGANQFMPDKGRFDALVECYENHAQDSRIKPIEVSDTRNQKDGTGGNNLPIVCHRQTPFVSTNSNGGDVMPTLPANMEKLGGDNQTILGGGTLSMNFEMYDKAENVNVNLCAKRAHDCMVIEKKEAK